jgi:uncharacterized protein (TIGR00725 family)
VSGRRPVVGVMGAGDGASPADIRLAETLGELLAAAGFVVLTGGRDAGVMAAATRGARRVPGSLTVGVLPGSGGPVAEGLDVAIFTGLGHSRNAVNILSSDVVVAVGSGGPGTASEVGIAIKAKRPLVLLAPPPQAEAFFRTLDPALCVVATPEETVRAVLDRLPPSRRSLTSSPPGPGSRPA